jgi:phage terminase large subunit
MTDTAQIALPPKLLPVFSGDADIRGAHGGRGSGKTVSFALMTAVRAYKWAHEGRAGIVLCGRQFMNSLDDSSLAEVKGAIRSVPWLEAAFEIGEKFIRTKNGLVEYKFAGLEHNINSIKSKSKILLCWVDEAETVSENAWQVLIPTLREEDSELWVTWNPASERSATHKRFRMTDDPRVKVAEINWRDNPKFPEILDRVRRKDKEERPESYSHVWEGDFQRVVDGAIYATEVADLHASGRYRDVPINPALPVHRVWDLGFNDLMSVILVQRVVSELAIVGYVSGQRRTLTDYIAEFRNDSRYQRFAWGIDYLPHDGFAKRHQTGQSDADVLRGMGCTVEQTPHMTVEQGIRQARMIFPRVYIDRLGTETPMDSEIPGLVECLTRYRRHINAQTQTAGAPLHDVHSNGADAFRYLAINADRMPSTMQPHMDHPIFSNNAYLGRAPATAAGY